MRIQRFDNAEVSSEEVNELFKICFGKDLDEKYWNWRFVQNPNFEKIYISYIKSEGRLVAYYAVSPVKFQVDREVKDCALSMMTMTHPDFTGKGYFTKLAEDVYDNLKSDGFYGVFGFANKNSHYGFRRRLNWSDLSPIITMTKKLENISKNDVVLEPVKECFFEKIKEGNVLSTKVKIDELFFQWRISHYPFQKYYEFIGKKGTCFLLKKFEDKEVDIVYSSEGDFFGEDFVELLNHLEQGFNSINIWVNLYSDKHLVLEKNKFSPDSFNSYLGFIPLNGEIPDYKNWELNMIDSDIF